MGFSDGEFFSFMIVSQLTSGTPGRNVDVSMQRISYIVTKQFHFNWGTFNMFNIIENLWNYSAYKSTTSAVNFKWPIKVLIAKRKVKFLKKIIQSSNVLCQMFADSAHAESGTYSAYSDRLIYLSLIHISEPTRPY